LTVGALDDADLRDETATLTLAAEGLATLNPTVLVDDDDVQAIEGGVSVSTTPEGTSVTFFVRLAHEPSGPVQLTATSSDDTRLSFAPATIDFDAGSYDQPQAVVMTSLHDADTRDHTVEVTLATPGAASEVTSVRIEDDDVQRIVASADALTVGEVGATTFAVRLAHDPSDPLEVSVASSDTSTVAVSPAVLRFDSTNFGPPQTVTVTGVDDIDLVDGSATVTLSSTGVTAVEVAVSVDDTDVQTIVASAAALAVDEGTSATLTVRLAHDPSGPVAVTVASSDASAASVSPARLDFDAGNFAEPQTVTITGVLDDDIESEPVTVTFTGAGVVTSVAVSVTDTTQPPYPVDMFVRGSFNGFELDDALVFEGGASYGARISLHADTHELKIADAAFSNDRTFSVSQAGPVFLDLGLPTPLQQAIGEDNNTLLSIGTPGIYRFDLEAIDLAAPVLTVSLDEPATYLRDMYVRGSFGGFEPLDRMTYEGSGRYTALVSLSPGVHEFKISDELFSADVTFSVSADGTAPIELDTPTPLELAFGFDNNTSLTISEPGLYLFDMDTSDPAAPILTISLIDVAPFAGSMYVRGGFNGAGLGNELRYEGDGRYGALITLAQSTHAFQIADEGFSPGATFSASASTPVVIGLAEPTTLVPVGPEDSDTLVTLDALGVYRFELDARDPGAPVLTVTLVEPSPLLVNLFVRGSFNSFSVTDPLLFLGDVDYEARIELAAGTHAFKIADSGFSPTRTFSAGTLEPVEITPGTPVPFDVAPGEDNNTLLTVEQPGTYLFDVQVLAPTTLLVTVTRETPAVADAPGASWLAAWLAALPGASR
jgi:hypothetical protein